MVKKKDCIDCKMYWNCGMSVFNPSDVKTIFPKLFNMKWNSDMKLKKDNGDKSINEKFLEGIQSDLEEKDGNETIDELIENMDDVVKDEYFDNFYNNLIS